MKLKRNSGRGSGQSTRAVMGAVLYLMSSMDESRAIIVKRDNSPYEYLLYIFNDLFNGGVTIQPFRGDLVRKVAYGGTSLGVLHIVSESQFSSMRGMDKHSSNVFYDL